MYADGAARAMFELSGPLSEWAGKLPGMRASSIMEIVERDLSRFTFVSPGSLELDQLKAQWQGIRVRIDPGAK